MFALPIVRMPVEFDDEPMLCAVEVYDVSSKWNLPAKLEPT